MRSHLFLFLLLTAPACAQVPSFQPQVVGYVTAVAGNGAFEVQGTPVQITGETRLYRQSAKANTPVSQLDKLYLGQSMQVWGHWNKKTHELTATSVVQVAPSIAEVRGGAMIDLVVPAKAPERILRADGYNLHLTPETILNFNAPLTSLADLTTNIWIEYRGVQQVDGSVTVNAAEVWPNTVPKDEDKLRTKNEFEPANVDEGDRQSGASKFFHGVNSHKLPAHHDPELQARIERIGQSLVPAYQKALAESDPTRIHFRFQIVETDHFRDAVTFANGIILVPWPAIGRLQNDSQIAALLADNIACALEKQQILHQPAARALTAASWAGIAAGLIVPGASVATGITTASLERHAQTMSLRQSGRVSLALMHDAGYDIHEAPIAWRLLDPKKPESIDKAEIPERADYLYAFLGETWR